MSEEVMTQPVSEVVREAEALMEQGKHADALDVLQRARRTGFEEPQDEALLYSTLGACLAGMEQISDASLHYRKSADLYATAGDVAGQAKSTEQLGTMQHTRRQLKEASETYQKALRLWKSVDDKPGQARCVRNTANVSMDMGDREAATTGYIEARRLYKELGDLEGLAPCVVSAASLTYEKSGRVAAIEEYRRSLSEEACEHHLVLNNLGFLLILENQLDEARATLDKALADLEKRGMNHEDGGVLRLNLANVSALQKKYEEAEKFLTEALAHFDEDSEGRVIEAVLLPNSGYRDQEFDAYILADDALKSAIGRVNLATVLAEQGKLDAALEEVQKGVDLDRNNSYPYVVAGWIHLLRNDKDQAAANFRRAIGKEPNNKQIRKALEMVNPFLNQKVGRNDPCPCNSGKKFKKCHGAG